MRINTPIELPVYFNTEQTSQADQLGIKVNIDDCAVRRVMFITIDHFFPHKTACGKWRTMLVSSGCDYIVAMKYNDLKELLGFVRSETEG